jgi:hypothetical protein
MTTPKTNKTTTTKTIVLEEKVALTRAPNQEWLSAVYDIQLVSEEELKLYWEAFRYKGFNRDVVLAELEHIMKDPKIVVQSVIVCAMQGPVRASQLPLSNGKSLMQMGIPASGVQGTERLSCQRITAATADLAAFYMKRMNFPKRLYDLPLPGWLQFPSAGSIKLPDNLRQQHIEFHRRFSVLIGGTFRDDIYSTMVANAYLNVELRLFE